MRIASRILAILAVTVFTGPAFAITLVHDGVLNEWVGDEINNLGTEPSPGGGAYTLLAAWDGINLNVGIDRDSSDRYLGDNAWEQDSFYIAFDVDGADGVGADYAFFNDGTTGYIQFHGPKRPDIMYFYEGGPSWYKVAYWNGAGWTEGWPSLSLWSDAGAFYGGAEDEPNDELTLDLPARVADLGMTLNDSGTLWAWAWMAREKNGFVECTWPRGASGFVQQVFGAPLPIRDAATLLSLPREPNPGLYEEGVDTDVPLTVAWQAALASSPADPNVYVADPNLVSYKVYMSDALAKDPNHAAPAPILTYRTTVPRIDWVGTEASVTLNFLLAKDARYLWRVDGVRDDGTEVAGDAWMFYTESAEPIIHGMTRYQTVAEGATASFTVDVESLSTPLFQWYKVVDGLSDIQLSDGGDISGAAAATLSIANAEAADAGLYYCKVNNDSGVEKTSGQAPLAIRKKLAHWTFESDSYQSIVPGSPASVFHGDPEFTAGVAGNGIVFDADADADDMLYTDPAESAYFDMTRYEMTVGVWVKTTDNQSWCPLVACNGEENGWQLRHSSSTSRPCFTTRGTGNSDGTAANRPIYDGQWHYVVGTFDGTVKKVYIDGIVSRVYSADDGHLVKEGDAVTVPMFAAGSPVSIAGRYRADWPQPVEWWNNTAGTYDEVEIYNYALDAETIARNYAAVTGASLCLLPPASDLDGDCAVGLSDLSVMASEWLDDGLIGPGAL